MRRVVAISAVLVALTLATSEGAFFMRVKTTMRKALDGGAAVERSDATVNGRDATISVFAFDKPRHELVAEIAKALPVSMDGGFMASVVEGGVESRLLILPGADAGSCLAWLVESRTGDTAMPDDNILPGSDMLSHISIKRTGCVFSLHEVSGTPETAMRDAEAALRAGGWKLLLSGDRTSYFGKAGRQSVAVVAAFRAGNATRVAVVR